MQLARAEKQGEIEYQAAARESKNKGFQWTNSNYSRVGYLCDIVLWKMFTTNRSTTASYRIFFEFKPGFLFYQKDVMAWSPMAYTV